MNQFTRTPPHPNHPIVENKLDETDQQLTDEELVKSINALRTKLLKIGVEETYLTAQKAAAVKEATRSGTITVGEDGIATLDDAPPSLFSGGAQA